MKRVLVICLLLVCAALNTYAQEIVTDSTSLNPTKSDEIKALTVKAYRPIVKAKDGALRYNLKQLSEGTAVSNVYEAISKLPGVDEKDGAFQLSGAGKATIIINGKPSTMSAEQLETLLKSMPIERIKSADVMYSAPPQYNIRGAAINLILDRSMDNSYAGEVSAGYTLRREGSYGAGGSLIVSNPKWSADVLYRYTDESSVQIADLTSNHTINGNTTVIKQLEDIQGKSRGHLVRAAFDYTPKENRLLSISYNGKLVPYTNMLSASEGTYVESVSRKKGPTNYHNIALRYKAPSGFDIGADYTYYNTESTGSLQNMYSNSTASSFDITSSQIISRLNFYTDMKHSLGKTWGINYGVKASYVDDKDKQHYSSVAGDVTTLNTDSRLKEYTAELYAGTEIKLPKGSLSAALSGEYYKLGADERFTLYPQANFMWMFSKDHILQANLSSDKSYPSYWMMQNAISYVDGYSEIHGNPLLKPMRSYSAQLVYIFKQRYVFALFFSHTKDYFTQNSYQLPDRLALLYKYINFDYSQQYGINASIPFSIGKWFNTKLTLTGLRMQEKSSDFFGLSFNRSKWLAVASLDNTFQISQKPQISFELSAVYQTPAIQGLFDIEQSWSVDAGLKFAFLNKKLNLTANLRDIFETRMPNAIQNYAGQNMKLYTGKYTRTLSLNLAYRFGGYTAKQHKSVDTSRFGH